MRHHQHQHPLLTCHCNQHQHQIKTFEAEVSPSFFHTLFPSHLFSTLFPSHPLFQLFPPTFFPSFSSFTPSTFSKPRFPSLPLFFQPPTFSSPPFARGAADISSYVRNNLIAMYKCIPYMVFSVRFLLARNRKGTEVRAVLSIPHYGLLRFCKSSLTWAFRSSVLSLSIDVRVHWYQIVRVSSTWYHFCTMGKVSVTSLPNKIITKFESISVVIFIANNVGSNGDNSYFRRWWPKLEWLFRARWHSPAQAKGFAASPDKMFFKNVSKFHKRGLVFSNATKSIHIGLSFRNHLHKPVGKDMIHQLKIRKGSTVPGYSKWEMVSMHCNGRWPLKAIEVAFSGQGPFVEWWNGSNATDPCQI